jgi:hypothetical protein
MVAVFVEIDSTKYHGQGSTVGRGRTLSEDSDVSRCGCRISTVKEEMGYFVRHKGRPTCPQKYTTSYHGTIQYNIRNLFFCLQFCYVFRYSVSTLSCSNSPRYHKSMFRGHTRYVQRHIFSVECVHAKGTASQAISTGLDLCRRIAVNATDA